MRHPLWIVNTSLLFLFIVGALCIYISQPEVPKQKTVSKKSISTVSTKKVESIALSKIHENDLFDTVKQPLPALQESEKIQEAPNPPQPSIVVIRHQPQPTPLPPLSITLKGVMVVSDNSNNVVMISDNATTKEKLYKVGDTIQDAQILKIFNNRVVFVRSNGQQETIFLNEKDLLNDPVITQNAKDWSAVVTPIRDKEYEIYPTIFIQVIPNLATLLDMFEITTVYKEGQRIGCRIGELGAASFGVALGLQTNDILTKIYNKPVATFEDRLAAYREIQNIKVGDVCTLELLRNKTPLTLKYTLVDHEKSIAKYKTLITKDAAVEEKKGILLQQSPEELERERVAMLKEKYQFAPTVQEILLAQKNMMLHEGNENRLQDFSFANEAGL